MPTFFFPAVVQNSLLSVSLSPLSTPTPRGQANTQALAAAARQALAAGAERRAAWRPCGRARPRRRAGGTAADQKVHGADGLAHDQVNRVVRDSRGFLWFCTAARRPVALRRSTASSTTTGANGLPQPVGQRCGGEPPRRLVLGCGPTAAASRASTVGGRAPRRRLARRRRRSACAVFTRLPLRRRREDEHRGRALRIPRGHVWAGTQGGLFRLAAGDAARGKFERVPRASLSRDPTAWPR